MKPSRWVVWCLLGVSAAASLGAGAWWWITWPERTARELIALVSNSEFEQANTLLRPPAMWRSRGDGYVSLDDGNVPSPADEVWWRVALWKENFQPPLLQFRPRTVNDLLCGRRRLVVNNAWDLTAQHGKVSVHIDERSRGKLVAF